MVRRRSTCPPITRANTMTLVPASRGIGPVGAVNWGRDSGTSDAPETTAIPSSSTMPRMVPSRSLYQLHMSRSPATIGARHAIHTGSVELAADTAAISRSIAVPVLVSTRPFWICGAPACPSAAIPIPISTTPVSRTIIAVPQLKKPTVPYLMISIR
jgi:hypothetical protein